MPYERTSGVRVYADASDHWASSRPIWNQYAYHVTHVEDDGTVPATSEVEPNWSSPGLNNFRQNVLRGLPADATADLTVHGAEAPPCLDLDLRQPLSAIVCNRGNLAAPAGVVVEFRVDQEDGDLACSATTTEPLDPGVCVDVFCDWLDVPINEEHDLWVIVDPPAGGPGAMSECHDDNNLSFAPRVRCPPGIE